MTDRADKFTGQEGEISAAFTAYQLFSCKALANSGMVLLSNNLRPTLSVVLVMNITQVLKGTEAYVSDDKRLKKKF